MEILQEIGKHKKIAIVAGVGLLAYIGYRIVRKQIKKQKDIAIAGNVATIKQTQVSPSGTYTPPPTYNSGTSGGWSWTELGWIWAAPFII